MDAPTPRYPSVLRTTLHAAASLVLAACGGDGGERASHTAAPATASHGHCHAHDADSRPRGDPHDRCHRELELPGGRNRAPTYGQTYEAVVTVSSGVTLPGDPATRTTAGGSSP